MQNSIIIQHKSVTSSVRTKCFDMIAEAPMYFFITTAIFTLVAAQGNIGDICYMRDTNVQGTCKLSTDCPRVQELANNGVSPTICSIPLHTNKIIVCCEAQSNAGTLNTGNVDETLFDYFFAVNPLTQTDNKFLTGGSPDSFIFPESDNLPRETYGRKSEEKCVEYSKPVTGVVSAAPLITDPDPQIVSLNVEKCENAGLSLIVGGEPAGPGEFPFMAALGYADDNEIAWNCGGTLISDFYVVTAAHCAKTKYYGQPIKVRLGDLDLKSENDYSEYVDYGIADIKIHEQYRPPVRYNDIALIKLTEKVIFTKFIRPACLWAKFSFETTKTIATGWGKTGVADEQSDKLLKVELNIVDDNICNKTYPPNSRTMPDGIKPTMLCAGELRGGKDTCQGDSGGPLVVTRKANRCVFHIVGITSFGKGCGGVNLPAVYTKISQFVPWIENIVW